MWFVALFSLLLLVIGSRTGTVKTPKEGRAQLRGAACDYISLCRVSCPDGSKFVVKQEPGVRKQFLVLNGESVLAFVAKRSEDNAVKFAQCDTYRDITDKVGCKPVEGAAGLSLNSTGSPSPGPTNSGFKLPEPEVTMWLSSHKPEL